MTARERSDETTSIRTMCAGVQMNVDVVLAELDKILDVINPLLQDVRNDLKRIDKALQDL